MKSLQCHPRVGQLASPLPFVRSHARAYVAETFTRVGSAERGRSQGRDGGWGRMGEGAGCDHDKVHTGIVRGTRSHDYRRLGTELTNRIVNFSAGFDRARLRNVKCGK